MHCLTGAGAIFECALHLGILKNRAVGDGAVDLHEVLIYDTTGTDVEVTDLRVTHLSVGKTDEFAAGLKFGVRICLEKIVPVRCGSAVDGIGMVVLADTPAIENDKKCFMCHIWCYFMFISLFSFHVFLAFAAQTFATFEIEMKQNKDDDGDADRSEIIEGGSMSGGIFGITDICHYGQIDGQDQGKDCRTLNLHLRNDGMARRGRRSARRAGEDKASGMPMRRVPHRIAGRASARRPPSW